MSKSMADTSNILTNGVIFSALKHTDPHTIRGRSTQKDGVCNEHIFRNGSFRKLKIAKESNDLASFAKVVPESYQKSNEFSVNRKCGQNVATDDRRTFSDKDKGRRIQTLGRCHVGLRKWLINVSLIIITLGRLHSLFLLKLSTLSAAIFLFFSLVLSLLYVYYIRMLCRHV